MTRPDIFSYLHLYRLQHFETFFFTSEALDGLVLIFVLSTSSFQAFLFEDPSCTSTLGIICIVLCRGSTMCAIIRFVGAQEGDGCGPWIHVRNKRRKSYKRPSRE
jgi:hypothetical protein